jgi:hypothetical protein
MAAAASGGVMALIWRSPCRLILVFRIIVAAFARGSRGAPLISLGYEKSEIDY